MLTGAVELIDGSSPDLLVEVTDGDRIPDSVTWLIEYGQRIMNPTPRGPQLIAAEALRHMSNTRHSDPARYGEIFATRRTDAQIITLRQRITATDWPANP